METYVALLRGINVSGQKKIKMADLCSYLEELEFSSVQSYIQSGNIVFRAEETSIELLERRISEKILEKYGFDVPVLIKTSKELLAIYNTNPFLNAKEENINHLHITFLSKLPQVDLISDLNKYLGNTEKFVHTGREIYLFFPDGYGKTKLSNTLIERRLEMRATTRNWKTISKLVEMS